MCVDFSWFSGLKAGRNGDTLFAKIDDRVKFTDRGRIGCFVSVEETSA